MPYNISDLYDFVERAKRDRKYAENTAFGRKAALQLYEKELNGEEKASIELIAERLDKISQAVFSKNSKKFSSGTLTVYKRRMRNLIEDFLKYGVSAEGMASWQSGRKVAKPNTQKVKKDKKSQDETIFIPSQPASIFINNGVTHDLNVQLRSDLRLTLTLPYDLTTKEAERLKLLIDSMTMDQ